jgi:hypothetical protein
MRTTSCFAIVTIVVVTATAPVLAQQSAPVSTDARWTAWLGCWQQLEETVRDRNPIDADPRDAVPTPGVVVCVTPAKESAGVTFSTIVEKQSALEETVVADGSNRAIDEPGCKGSQRARWSETGTRLFAHAQLSCTDGSTRTISGLTTIAPGPVWVEIQVVNSDGRESIRIRRYRRSPDQTYVNARLTRDQLAAAAAAAARQARSFSLEDVKEASTKVTPSTVEAALIETDAQFPLNANRLRELDAAGVPDRVLDLMIALSFPNKFVVERRTSSSSSLMTSGGGYPIGGLGWMDLGYDLFPYHYAPFGYGMWGRSDYYYYGAPVYSVGVVADDGPQPSGQGRVVDGMGYTRVRSRDPQPANPGGMVAGGSDGGGGSSSSGGSSSGGSGVSSQGYSGGGGGDSGRTAVSRPPE